MGISAATGKGEPPRVHRPPDGHGEITGKRQRTRSNRSPTVRRYAKLRPNCRKPRLQDFPGNPLRPSLRTLRADADEVMHEARSSDAVPLRDANVSHQLLLTAWVKRLLSCRVRVWSEALLMRLAVRASRSSAGSYSPQGASNSGSETTA